MAETYDLGPLSIGFENTGPIGRHLLAEFDSLESTNQPTDIVFSFESGFVEPPNRGTWIDDRIWVDGEYIFFDLQEGNLLGDKRYQVELVGNPLNGCPTITIYHDGKLNKLAYRFCHRLVQQLNWKYITRQRVVADNILYDLLEPIVHQRLLATDHAFIHASAVSNGKSGILFPGWGGTGKTSSCIQLVDNKGYSFLADDLAIISSDGEIYPYTKLMQIYPYNLKNKPKSEKRVLAGRNPIDRLQWHVLKRIKGSKGVCRRVPPSQYFGNQDYNQCPQPIATAVYLSRECTADISLSDVESTELGTRASSVIAHEFDYYFSLARAVHAAEPNIWPSVEEILSRSKAVYSECFSHVESPLCRIPRQTTPAELAEFIQREIL